MAPKSMTGAKRHRRPAAAIRDVAAASTAVAAVRKLASAVEKLAECSQIVEVESENANPSADAGIYASRKAQLALARAGKKQKLMVNRVNKGLDAMRTKIRRYNKNHAVRKADIINADVHSWTQKRRQDVIRGKGKYRELTSATILRVALGRASSDVIRFKKGKAHIAKGAAKSPTMFSLNSLAFWLGTSTTTISQARNGLANLYLEKQQESFHAMVKNCSGVVGLGLHIEFDETGQKLRLKRSWCTDHLTTLSVLVSRTTSFKFERGKMTSRSVINAPVVLWRQTATSIWRGLLQKQMAHPFSLAGHCDVLVLTFVCDNASANGSMVGNVVNSAPKNCLVAMQRCLMHQTYLTSEIAWKTLGCLPDMFNCSSILSQGSLFLELIMKVRHLLLSKLVVKYDRPEPENILYAQSIMQEAHRRSPHPFDGVPDHAAEEEDRKARDHSAKMLLMMANGDWTSPVPVHHCKLGCCMSQAESSEKFFAAFLDYALCKRPTIPNISRWLSCGENARFYMLGFALHNLLGQAWQLVFHQVTYLDEAEGPESRNASHQGQLVLNDDVALGNSLAYQRVQRIRAKRVTQWMEQADCLPRLLCASLLLSPVERVMFHLLKEMRKQAWMDGEGRVDLLPAVKLTSPHKSMAAQALKEYFVMGTSESPTCFRGFNAQQIHMATFVLFSAIGHVWGRLYHAFQVYPHKLGILLDGDVSLEAKTALVHEFMRANECCLDRGFSLPLRRFMQEHHWPAEALLPGGPLIYTVRLLSMRKLVNAQIECNFARAASQRQVCRGRGHSITTMVSKFVLTELQKEHQRAVLDFQRSRTSANQDDEDTAGVGGTFNGFSLLLKDRLAQRVLQPGESRIDANRRVWQQTIQDWSDASVSFKQAQSKAAKDRNLLHRAASSSSLVDSRGCDDGGDGDGDRSSIIPYLQNMCEIADMNYAIGEKVLDEERDKVKGWLKTSSAEFERRHGQVSKDILEDEEEATDNGKFDEACPAFCCCQAIRSTCSYGVWMERFLLVLRIARYIRKDKGYSPDHPLIAVRRCGQASLDSLKPGDECWLLARIQFRPYDACILKMTLESEEETSVAMMRPTDVGMPDIVSLQHVLKELCYQFKPEEHILSVLTYSSEKFGLLKILRIENLEEAVERHSAATAQILDSEDEEDKKSLKRRADLFKKALNASKEPEPKQKPRPKATQNSAAKTKTKSRRKPVTELGPDVEEDPEEPGLSGQAHASIEQEWLAAIDAHEPVARARGEDGPSTIETASASASSSTAQPSEDEPRIPWKDGKGNVYFQSDPKQKATLLGRITEVRIGEPGHSVSIRCSLHKDCKVMISAKKLFGQDSSEHRMMQWLQAGLAIRDRADGDKHKMTWRAHLGVA